MPLLHGAVGFVSVPAVHTTKPPPANTPCPANNPSPLPPLPPPPQVLTAIIKTAQLPAAVTNNRDSTGCVPAGAAYRMDENLTVFAVRACAKSGAWRH